MPVELKWYKGKRVYLIRFYGRVTIDEVRYSNIEGTKMVDESGESLVHTIVDLRDIEDYPKQISQFRDAMTARTPRGGWSVIIGGNTLVRFIANVATKIVGGRFAMANNYYDALEFLTQRDGTLLQMLKAEEELAANQPPQEP